MTNPLAALIAAQIRADGPLSLAQYMALALGHPAHGYYMTRDPLGRAGDFTTAPEISQMFGELIGLWCVETWAGLGAPGRVVLAELGPGRGTLMADLLRAAGAVSPAFRAAADIWMVETSPVLKAVQQKTLGAAARWADHPARLPPGPVIVVANEFFDALPVRQFARTEKGWRERMVGLDGERLVLALAPEGPGAVEARLPAGAPVGAIAEICPEGEAVAALIGDRLATSGGAALIVDYGHGEGGYGDTVQAMKAHAYADILAEPGEADLTAHVDFRQLAAAAKAAGARAWGPVPQGAFLAALGIGPRAERLAAKGGETAKAVGAALRRLTHPDEMGTLFKVLALTGPDAAAPPGFPPPAEP